MLPDMLYEVCLSGLWRNVSEIDAQKYVSVMKWKSTDSHKLKRHSI